MGRSAQVESLRQQLKARDAEIRRLQHELEQVRAMSGLVEENHERANAELAEHEKAFAVAMPIVDAAVELTRINDSCQWADSMLTDDLTQVSTAHYNGLFQAVSRALEAVTAGQDKSA